MSSQHELIEKQVNDLATLLGLAVHHDPEITLKAIDKYLKLAALSSCSQQEESQKQFSLESFDLGVRSTVNPKVDDAIRVIRLIHVAKQRELQTQINELLAGVQAITANPKADLTLARLGR